MEKKLTMHLAKAARSNGGDRYECDVEGEERPVVIYWPQSISREKGVVKPQLKVTVED